METHFSRAKFDCPGRGCGRTGEHGFDQKDHLHEHLRKVHVKDIPKRNSKVRKIRSTPQTFLSEELERYNPNLEAPSQLKAQDENSSEMPPPPPIEPVRYSSRNLKPVELPKTTTMVGDEAHSSNLDRLRSASSQYLYVTEERPGTASGRKESISHNVGEDDKESPSPTDLERARTMHVAPEPGITYDESLSQAFVDRFMERHRSSIYADVELSIMTMTGGHEIRDVVKPAKIVSEPDNEARTSTLNHPSYTPDADDELMSGLSDEDSDDYSVVDGPLFSSFLCILFERSS